MRSPASAIPEVVEDGVNGLLVAAGDGAAGAIRALALDPDRSAETRRPTREDPLRECELDSVFSRLESILPDLPGTGE